MRSKLFSSTVLLHGSSSGTSLPLKEETLYQVLSQDTSTLLFDLCLVALARDPRRKTQLPGLDDSPFKSRSHTHTVIKTILEILADQNDSKL